MTYTTLLVSLFCSNNKALHVLGSRTFKT